MSDVEKNIGTHKPEFAGEWVKLGDLLTEYKELNVGNRYRPVAVGRFGIRAREDIYTKELAKDYSKNKVIHQNTLTVGMGSKQIDIGILTSEERYSVSPAYHTYHIGDVDCDYLRYCLEARNADMFKRFAKRGTRQGKTIDLKRWLGYRIYLPSKERQAAVVRRLDAVERQIGDCKAMGQRLDDLVKSQFVEMFGGYGADSEYRCARLGKLLSVEPQNGLYKPQRYYRTDCGGTPIVRVDAFSDGSVFSYASLKRLDCSESELENYALHEGDIVMNRVNGSIERVGKVALIKGLDEATVYESNMMRFHVDESRLNATYIVHVLCSDDIRKQIKSCARIANQCSVNQENIAGLQIPLPPLALQRQFADFVARVDKLGFDVQQQIEKLETLKRSLMQEYFG